MNRTINKRVNKHSSLLIFFLILIFISSSLKLTNQAQATTNEWASITPPDTSGVSFNAISVVGSYVFIGSNNGIYRSDDSGANWTNSLTTECGGSACDITSIAIGWIYDGTNYIIDNSTIILAATSNGGIFKSTIGSPSWTASNTGLTDTNIQDIKFDQFNYTTIYAGTAGSNPTERGVYRSDDSGDTWTLKNSGLSNESVIKIASDFGDLASEVFMYSLTNDNNLYYSDAYSYTSLDENWLISTTTTTILRDININQATGYFGYLAAQNGVLKTSGPSLNNWTLINDAGLTNTDINTITSDYLISDQIVYAGTSGGGVFKKIISGANSSNWTQINNGLSDANILDIETDPQSSLKVYAVGSQWVYKLELSDAYAMPIFIPAEDTTAPAQIPIITPLNVTANFAVLSWTAPGDDNNTGTASQYDIRYATSTITSLTWDSLLYTRATTTPQAAGSQEVYTISGLNSDTTYYFAIKTADEVPNWSLLSDAINIATTDNNSPATINNLSINLASSSSAILSWTAPGDDNNTGTASQYDIRYATSTITSLTWDSLLYTRATTTPQAADSSELYTINALSSETVYYFAIKTADEVLNWSSLSNIASTTTADVTAPILTLIGSSTVSMERGSVYTDAGATALDSFNGDITANIVTTNPVNMTATGTYAVRYNVSDSSGNAAVEITRTVNIVDTTAPVLAEITNISTPTNDSTPDYTFSSNEAGIISYSGGCLSPTTIATSSNNTITFNTLADGAYSDCKITVTDYSGNASSVLNITSFTVTTPPPPPPVSSGGGSTGGGGSIPVVTPINIATSTISNTASTTNSNINNTNILGINIIDYSGATNLSDIKSELVEIISKSESDIIFSNNKSVIMDESSKRIYKKINDAYKGEITLENKYREAYFIKNGTPTTKRLGAGERGGVLNSYISAFGKFPSTSTEWQDIIKIANGRWSKEKNLKAEENAKKIFKKIYLRDANMKNQNDNAAITIIAYGLRPVKRNTESEKAAIKIFKAIYKYNAISALDWDIVRAIANSGAKR